jgi:SAM-dependent methyltransferase
MSEQITCPCCQSELVRHAKISHPFFRHMDFAPMQNQPGYVAKCEQCGFLFADDRNIIEEISEIYAGQEYAENKKTEYYVYGKNGGDASATTYDVLADKIIKTLKPQPCKFLDIGCFDGKLLQALNERRPNGEYHGFDVSEYIGDIFPSGENFRYWAKDISAIRGRFDVVSLINVLMYVDEPRDLISFIKSLLSESGFIIFSMPDIRINPYALLLGDQRLHFSPTSASRLFAESGFIVDLVEGLGGFSRNVVGIARPTPSSEVICPKDCVFDEIIPYLDNAKKSLLDSAEQLHKAGTNGRIGVLGYNVNAAWAYSVLGDKVACFVDENPTRIGNWFYGRRIVHPSEMNEQDLIILPYGDTSGAISEKFSTQYAAQVLAI